MAWPYTKSTDWGFGEDPRFMDNQPMDANSIIYGGAPAGFNSASAPANCIRAYVSGDVFAGVAVRTADNTTASASQPNILYGQNFGDGTTGVGGCKVRLCISGLLRFGTDVPNGTGTAGAITGLAGTQADVNKVIYYNGTGFTTTQGGEPDVFGVVEGVGTTLFSTTFWDIRFRSQVIRNS